LPALRLKKREMTPLVAAAIGFGEPGFIPPASANNRGKIVAASAASGSAWDRCRPAAA